MVLEGFPDAPAGVLIAANVAILIHMLSAFQTYGQVGRGWGKPAAPAACRL